MESRDFNLRDKRGFAQKFRNFGRANVGHQEKGRMRVSRTYLADRDIAPPGQEGWTRHQEKYREASFDGADGVVVQDKTEMFLNLNHHPVCAASDASHFVLTGAVTPPVQEGRWPRKHSPFLRVYRAKLSISDPKSRDRDLIWAGTRATLERCYSDGLTYGRRQCAS